MADNGSSDSGPDLAREWSARDPRIRLVDASGRPGPAAARNIGVKAARGDLLAFCDADDVVQPGWLAGLVTALGRAEVVAGVFDSGSLNGRPPSPPRPASTGQLGIPSRGARCQPRCAPSRLRRSGWLRRGAPHRRGHRLELAPAAARTPLRDRARRGGGEAGPSRPRRGLPPRARLWSQRAPALPPPPGRGRSSRPGRRGTIMALDRRPPAPALPCGPARNEWVHAFGMRVGRLLGSVSQGVFFP